VTDEQGQREAAGEVPADDSAEFGETLLQQTLELWVIPEITRRREAGSIEEGWVMERAQVTFGNGEGSPQVRLNDEVKGTAIATAARPISKGELVRLEDISGISDVLRAPEDEDLGHLTLLPKPGGGWFIAFDFRRNASHMRAHADHAEGFIDVAAVALEAERLGVFVENLLAAVELLAKALLIWAPDERMLQARTHKTIHTRFNSERQMGNVDARFADLLNRLAAMRGSARYLRGELELETGEATELLAVSREMLKAARDQIPRTAGDES
jgi:uncharacterized protein (UPF0332 family)